MTPSLLRLKRAHDSNIMDMILESNTFSKAEICRLNYCRVYLQATTLSDLVMVSGRGLDNNKLLGKSSLLSRITSHMHVYRERPSDAEWKLWKKANRQWSNDQGRLYQSLGPQFRRLFVQQNSIGWRQIFSGRFGTEWERLQDDYYGINPEKRKRCTGLW